MREYRTLGSAASIELEFIREVFSPRYKLHTEEEFILLHLRTKNYLLDICNKQLDFTATVCLANDSPKGRDVSC